jgi:hypothetical protein
MKNNKNPWLSLRMNSKWLSASVTKTKLYKAYLQTNFMNYAVYKERNKERI